MNLMNELLSQRYCNILKRIDKKRNIENYLDKPASKGGKRPEHLSGLFLTSVGSDYDITNRNIMIVGRETAGWEPLFKKSDGKSACGYDDFESVSEYVKKSINRHQRSIKEEFIDKKGDRGFTFHNFARKVASICGISRLIYSNLFCFDFKKGSPTKSDDFGFIKELSKKLLDAQIELLQPEFIIFANGASSARYRLEYFPKYTNSIDWEKTPHNIENRHLWSFTLNERIKCYRIQHPCTTSLKAQEARKFVLELLAAEINEKPLHNVA